MTTINATAAELRLGDRPTNEAAEDGEIVGIVPAHDGTWVYFGEDGQAWASTFLPVDGTLEVTR